MTLLRPFFHQGLENQQRRLLEQMTQSQPSILEQVYKLYWAIVLSIQWAGLELIFIAFSGYPVDSWIRPNIRYEYASQISGPSRIKVHPYAGQCCVGRGARGAGEVHRAAALHGHVPAEPHCQVKYVLWSYQSCLCPESRTFFVSSCSIWDFPFKDAVLPLHALAIAAF